MGGSTAATRVQPGRREPDDERQDRADSLMVALVGAPIARAFRRISQGRRRMQYIVIVLTLLLVVALSVIAPMTWLQLGVLQPLTVPE